MEKMKQMMRFLVAGLAAVACWACHEEEGPERVYLTVYGFDTVRMDGEAVGSYRLAEENSAELSMYLCGPVDGMYPEEPRTYFTPEVPDLAALLELTDGRLMNDRVVIDTPGNDYGEDWRLFYWWPTADYVEVGKRYLWVVCVHFPARPDWQDVFWIFEFRVSSKEDKASEGDSVYFYTKSIN